MQRKDFLKSSLGIFGIGAIVLSCNKETDTPAGTTTDGTCTTSAETAGPYPTVSPSSLSRSNIADGQEGVPLTINITVTNNSNSCAPLAGAIVDIMALHSTWLLLRI